MFFSNKLKIINDPVYGFITIPNELVYDIIEHPWFQRLRRIHQLGLTHYTYPSAQHSRFQHALGALHLMTQAIQVLRSKEIPITDKEAEGVVLAILLHDIGHGPFSHSLEKTLVRDLHHEEISAMFFEALNKIFHGALDTAKEIFLDIYPKRFLHQLVSSQLDMDRLDYLARDSFFTGVAEGVIGYDRIIKMLTVEDDELVVEGKGIYSIEKFLISRRLMYWQVYLHKTVIAADQLLVTVLRRAKFLASRGDDLFATPTLKSFLMHQPGRAEFLSEPGWLDLYARLDDFDIFSAIKAWAGHPDRILSHLSGCLIDRKLFRVELQSVPFDPDYSGRIRKLTMERYTLTESELPFYFACEKIENKAYNPLHDRIMIKSKSSGLTDISKAAEENSQAMLPTTVSKYLLYYPKDINN